jgi:predicted nucleic acid-binding protein
MTTVLDASAALAWCMPDEFDDDAEALLECVRAGKTIVPPLWLYEMENAVRSAFRRRRITQAQAREILAHLAMLPIRVVDVPERPAFNDAFSIAIQHDISVYDAIYLDLAKRYRARLASRDARVRNIADRMNIPCFPDGELHG